MSPNKPRHLVFFAASLGLFVYLASSLWSALFVVALPQLPDAVVDAYPVESEVGGRYNEHIETEGVPIEFKNTLEELKYYHNVRMRDRNRYWVYGILAFGALAGAFVFFVVPRWGGTLGNEHDTTGALISGAFFGVFAALIVPMILSWVLPAPVSWFPGEILEIAENRKKEMLIQLERQAAMIDRADAS
jgi:hypothetical protein